MSKQIVAGKHEEGWHTYKKVSEFRVPNKGCGEEWALVVQEDGRAILRCKQCSEMWEVNLSGLHGGCGGELALVAGEGGGAIRCKQCSEMWEVNLFGP